MLKNTLLTYQNLKHKTYEIEYEKIVSGIAVKIRFQFEFRDDNFKHLSGLHKLGLGNLKSPRDIPNKIVHEKINFEQVKRAPKFENFLRRATALQLLSIALSNPTYYNNIYEYSSPDWSKLEADFLIHFRIRAYDYYLFLKKIKNNRGLDNGTISCAPVSFFRNEPNYSKQRRYEHKQTKVKLTSVSKTESSGLVTKIYPWYVITLYFH